MSEACLCRNDVTDPGTFYLAPGAEAALICGLRFALPLTLIDLSGITLSKLGLSDDISSPDHEGMQWLGCMIDAVIAGQDGRIAGIGYPSRSIAALRPARRETRCARRALRPHCRKIAPTAVPVTSAWRPSPG